MGLITGCFDVIHAGHVDLFRFAKKHCDLVIVGLDSDETVKLNKSPGRPIHDIFQRERVLSELVSVDLIFCIDETMNFTKGAEARHIELDKKIRPHYLVTNPIADKFWRNKERTAMAIGAKLLLDRRKKGLSSSRIIKFFAGEL